jgi:hypothetical protein
MAEWVAVTKPREMSWEKPEIVEVEMNAEIGAYQKDDDPPNEPVTEDED